MALARAAGLPAREVHGLVPDGGEPPLLVPGSWAEVRTGGTWVAADPLAGRFPADAARIALVRGPDPTFLHVRKARHLESASVIEALRD